VRPRETSRAARLAATCLAGAALASAAAPAGAVPSYELPIGRPATPAGRITPLRTYPTAAVPTPDGKRLPVIPGPSIQGGAPNGGVALASVDPPSGRIRQLFQTDDAFQSIVFDRRGRRVYVAGGSDRVVHVLRMRRHHRFSLAYDLPTGSLVTGLALSRNGRHLWVAQSEVNRVLRMDPRGVGPTKRYRARSPDQLALSPNGRTVYATNWRGGTVAAIPTGRGRRRKLRVGEHPTALAFAGRRLLVANSNDATLSSFEPGSRKARRVDLAQIGRRSDSPNAIAVAPSGRTAYVSLGGDNAVAVVKLMGRRWQVAGLIPTGWYPTAVALTKHGRRLHVVTARGLARSAAATKPYSVLDPSSYAPDGAYATIGTLETLRVPGAAALAGYTAQVR